MRDSEVLLYAGVAIAGIYVLNSFKGKPLTQEQAEHQIIQAGGVVTTTELGSFYQIPGGSVSMQQEWTPNFAQNVLIGRDSVIPGDWLTRKVLGL